MTAKKENRGGARPNSGPKPSSLSANQVKALLRTVKKYAKEYGKTIDDILLDFAYGVTVMPLVDKDGTVLDLIKKTVSTRDRIASIKIVKDLSAPKISEGGEADRTLGPSIYLPEQKPTLAAVTDIKKAKKDPEGEA